MKSKIKNPKSKMIYTGIDLIEVDRIAQSISRWGERFLALVYTPAEIEYANGRAAELAARFAAKEAAAKALGTGIWRNGVRWLDVEVVSDRSGRPSLKLHGSARARAKQLQWKEVSLSLSHSREHAVALVVAIGDSAVVLSEAAL